MSDNFSARRNDVSRRDFLTTGMMLSTAALAALSNNPKSQAAASISIQPALVGPFYYDEAEKDSVLGVVESRTPFRYWGNATPTKVKSFEEGFAEFMGVKFALAVTSGTTALNSAIAALGVGPGDEVIVPAYSWWSDYTCVVHSGALPVFADIDNTLCIDPKSAEKKITPRTKAIIAVHLLGGPCDMDPLLEIAAKHKIKILEDCAQCVGGSYKGKRLGSIGDIGIYSFQVNKMISSGEGGAVVTNDPLLYERAARFHDMGMMRDVFEKRLGSTQLEDFAGENYRMNEFTGAILGAQLPKLGRMIEDQRRHAVALAEAVDTMDGLRLRRQPDPKGDIGYAVFVEMRSRSGRDALIKALTGQKIPAGTLSGSVMLPAEESVIAKRTRHPNWPSFTSPEGKAIAYGPDTCEQSRDIFDRFVMIRIGPNYTQEHTEFITQVVKEAFPRIAVL